MLKNVIENFENPGCEFRGAPFWAWNGKLDPEELRWQIRKMKEMGLGGFFMHSRTGLDTPYLSEEWFECMGACVDEAEKLDMKAWLYDEDRWPSGAAGGLVTANPEYRSRMLLVEELYNLSELNITEMSVALFKAKVNDNQLADVLQLDLRKLPEKLEKGEKILHFYVKLQDSSSWYNGETYLDTLNHDAVKKFIEVTDEKYKNEVKKYFGKCIPGIFTDEPNFPQVCNTISENIFSAPWTEKLPVVFEERYGYDIIKHLPEIFYNLNTDKTPETKYHFMDCITFLFTNAFAKQIGQWCEENNILHTGHVLAEDTLSSQTCVVGSCMRFYEYMQAPGMDLLTEHWKIYNTAKQVSSVARQFDRKWRLTETYGCTGWDFSLEGHKALGNWQAALGINIRCQHIAWYTMQGEAKRDYPGSISYQSPWYKKYSGVEDYFGRLNLALSQGKEVRDLLVLHPSESMWLKIEKNWISQKSTSELNQKFIDMSNLLLENHLDFDYADEEIIARHAKIEKNGKEIKFKINEASYSTILVTNMKTIRSSTLKLLEKFIEQGGNVVFCGNPPELVNAIPSHKAEILAKKTVAIPEKGDYLLNYLNDKVRRLSICDEQNNELKNVLYQLREDEQGYYLFICNTGYNEKQLIIPEKNDPTLVRERNEKHPDVHIKWHEKMLPEVLELDLSSGTFSAIKMQKRGGIAEIKTELSPIEGRMFFLSKKSLNFEYPEKIRLKEIAKSEINMQNCNIQLSEPNVLVLDYPAYKIADSETWNDPNEILRIDMYVRDSLNLNRRGGQMLQPWAKKKKNDPKSIMVDLEYSFNADYIPENDVFIALECPETFSITLNGTPIDTDNIVGWWVDKSLQKIKIPADSIKNGENILQLSCNYSEEHSGLEIIYLLGDFGVELSEGRVLLNNPIETLKIGDWVPQGLPFYSGAVSYNTKINLSQDRDKKYFLYIPEYRGTAIEVNVNGKSAGSILWRPNEVEITELLKNGENLLKIEVVSHRRNSHGPLHHNEKWPEWTGPWQFTTENDEWQNEYQLVPCGLMKTPEIIIKKGI